VLGGPSVTTQPASGGLSVRTVIETASLVRRGDMKATEALDETL
jgi:hypothetical protein